MTGHICLSPCYSLLHSLPFFSSRSSYSNSPCRTGALGQLLLSQADERVQIFVAFCDRLWVDVGHNEPRQKKPEKNPQKNVLKPEQSLSTLGEGGVVFWENAIAMYSICAGIREEWLLEQDPEHHTCSPVSVGSVITC